MPPSHRGTRLTHLLSEEMQSILREAADPGLAPVVVLNLTLSPDGGHARIAYAAPDPATAATALVRATGFVRARLADQLNLKKLPRLTFTCVGGTP